MQSEMRRSSNNLFLLLAAFVTGVIATNVTSRIYSIVHTSVTGISIADLARPEVFAPAFLLLVLCSMPLVMREAATAGKPSRAPAASQFLSGKSGMSEEPAASIAAERANLVRARDEIEQQLQTIFSTVGSYVQNSGRYSKTLDDARTDLDVAQSLEQVRVIVETLVTENARASSEAKRLRGNLETATQHLGKLRESLKEARTQAAIDPLTGVANRRSFDMFMKESVDRSHSEQVPMCLILADIDHFKKINDTHGHLAGDEVLRGFAKLLKTSVRSTDLVARFGGEEFSIVLPRTTSGSALEIAERLRNRISLEKFSFQGKPIGRITASLGVAAIQPNETAEELIERADRRVYEAKVKGRNRVEIDTSGCA